MYPATLLVIAAVALMFLFWAGFLLWALRSGQFEEDQELRRLPLEDENHTAVGQQNNG